MGLNSRRRICLAAFAALALLGTIAAIFLRYSTLPEIAPSRLLIRPPQPPEWSAAWKHDWRGKPVLAKSLSEDQIEVYRAFLKSYGTVGGGRLNVGNRTIPLEIS